MSYEKLFSRFEGNREARWVSLEAQLAGLGGQQKGKVKKVLGHFASASSRSLACAALAAWRGLLEQTKADKALRDMYEEQIADAERHLLRMKASCKALAKDNVDHMAKAREQVLLQQWLLLWQREVVALKSDRVAQEQVQQVLGRVYTTAKKQASHTTHVMTRQAREQQAALLGETWALWLCFVSDCRKETGGESGAATPPERNIQAALALPAREQEFFLALRELSLQELAGAFQREDELQEEIQPESSGPPQHAKGQLENVEMKCKRLRAEGSFLAQAERYAEALQHWEEALLFTEDIFERAPVLEQMAQVLLILERPFDAIRTAEQAVESRPLWYAGHLTLGRALLNFGELERAVECLRRGASLLEAQVQDKGNSSDAEELTEIRLELAEAEKLYAEVRDRAKSTSEQVIINGRVVESHFWETAHRVTYDKDGRPTTHYPSG
ncbi:ttc33 [Symbiodinium sp. CCMP2592]|nr:ttc33 [Symbiodinium sp. CCMP2592]